MPKAYTQKGDSGYTRDCSGKRRRKDDPVIQVCGQIDALQSGIDAAMLGARGRQRPLLQDIQRKLWQAAAEVSKCDKKCLIAPVTDRDVHDIERHIDGLGRPPTHFVRFTTLSAIRSNECRVRPRALERLLVPMLKARKIRPAVYHYINRLSSLFFMLAYKS